MQFCIGFAIHWHESTTGIYETHFLIDNILDSFRHEEVENQLFKNERRNAFDIQSKRIKGKKALITLQMAFK